MSASAQAAGIPAGPARLPVPRACLVVLDGWGLAPPSPGNSTTPKVIGTAEGGATVKIYKMAGCTGTPAAKGTAGQFHSPGIAVSVQRLDKISPTR